MTPVGENPGNEVELVNLQQVLSFASFAVYLDDPRRPRNQCTYLGTWGGGGLIGMGSKVWVSIRR